MPRGGGHVKGSFRFVRGLLFGGSQAEGGVPTRSAVHVSPVSRPEALRDPKRVSTVVEARVFVGCANRAEGCGLVAAATKSRPRTLSAPNASLFSFFSQPSQRGRLGREKQASTTGKNKKKLRKEKKPPKRVRRLRETTAETARDQRRKRKQARCVVYGVVQAKRAWLSVQRCNSTESAAANRSIHAPGCLRGTMDS